MLTVMIADVREAAGHPSCGAEISYKAQYGNIVLYVKVPDGGFQLTGAGGDPRHNAAHRQARGLMRCQW
jgi:hypothetical protein